MIDIMKPWVGSSFQIMDILIHLAFSFCNQKDQDNDGKYDDEDEDTLKAGQSVTRSSMSPAQTIPQPAIRYVGNTCIVIIIIFIAIVRVMIINTFVIIIITQS